MRTSWHMYVRRLHACPLAGSVVLGLSAQVCLQFVAQALNLLSLKCCLHACCKIGRCRAVQYDDSGKKQLMLQPLKHPLFSYCTSPFCLHVRCSCLQSPKILHGLAHQRMVVQNHIGEFCQSVNSVGACFQVSTQGGHALLA